MSDEAIGEENAGLLAEYRRLEKEAHEARLKMDRAGERLVEAVAGRRKLVGHEDEPSLEFEKMLMGLVGRLGPLLPGYALTVGRTIGCKFYSKYYTINIKPKRGEDRVLLFEVPFASHVRIDVSITASGLPHRYAVGDLTEMTVEKLAEKLGPYLRSSPSKWFYS